MFRALFSLSSARHWPLAALGFVLLISSANAQIAAGRRREVSEWEQLGPLPGAGPSVASLCANTLNPHDVYASSTAGILRSEDGGATWRLHHPWPEHWGLAPPLAVSPPAPSRMALTRYLVGVRISSDGGATWREPATPPAATRFRAPTFDPVDPDTLFVSCDTGIWRSTDGGVTFAHALDTTGDAVPPNSILIDRNNRLRVYASAFRNGIHVSHDGGDTWELRPYPSSQVTQPAMAIDPMDGRRILINQDGGYLSEDEGITWTSLGFTGGKLGAISFDPFDRSRFYAGQFYDGVLVSDDAGFSWNLYTDPVLDAMGGSPNAILPSISTPGEILVCGWNGFALSRDQGVTFERSNAGLQNHANVESIAVAPGDPYHLVAKTGASAYVSLDGGASWTESVTGPRFIGYDVVADQGTPGRFYAGGFAGDLHRSDDGGFTFSPVFVDSVVYFFHLEPHPTQANVLYGAGRGVQRSDDGGVTFTNLGVPQNWVWDVAVSKSNPDVIYASSTYDVYFSRDAGATWTAATIPPEIIVRDLEVDPRNPDRAWAASPGDGLFLTQDGGVTWRVMSPDLEGAQSVHRPASYPELLVVSDWVRQDAHVSYTRGMTSFVVDRGLGSVIRSFASTATELYAASAGNGVCRLR